MLSVTRPIDYAAQCGVGQTVAAQQHLRAILGHFDAPTMGQPEGFVQMTPGLIDDDFRVTVPATEEFLRAWLAAAVDHVARHS